VLDGTKILSETVTDNAYYNSYTLYYVYDANGSITGLHYNGAPYYFQKSIQGDVLRICNAGGAVVVEYTYDAWGNILSITGSMANTLGQYNPFRYRGYYYDSETDLYYLNSRYYDAEVGRFLNQDVYISTGEGIRGYNMFAYCLNNPVTRTDISGADSFSVTEGDDDNPMDDLGASNLGVGGGSGGGTVNGGGGGVSGGTGSTGNTVTANSNGGTLKGSSNVPAAQNSGWQVGGALPLSGVANTIMFLFSADGYLKQMRIIGPDGSKGYDIDFTHGGNHLFPHVHCWDFTQTPPSRN
jgi:RHS repeat-associated protein